MRSRRPARMVLLKLLVLLLFAVVTDLPAMSSIMIDFGTVNPLSISRGWAVREEALSDADMAQHELLWSLQPYSVGLSLDGGHQGKTFVINS